MAARPQTQPSLSLPKRYANVALIGAGGFGRVFRVRDSVRNLDLALKVVGPAEATWLLREFDTLRQIRHENLVRVFDWGTLPSGDAYYTMEFIDGSDWGAAFGKPQLSEHVIQVLRGTGRALAHLHSHGEVHGDLKPANVLLGDGGVVKLTDVGMGSTAGARQNVSGTPGYVAPEVWEGAAGDVRSDIYSVGVMAYEALTGRHPFAGKTIKDVVTGQLEGWVPSPRAHGVTIPASLERAIMRALERKPALRHGSVDEFLEDLGIQDRVGEILGGKIVGRDAEIGELDRLLAAKDANAPTLVHITGPPGVGKTSLVEEFAQRLLARGGTISRPAAPSAEGVADAMSHAETSAASRQAPGGGTLLNVSDALVRASDEAPVFVYFAAPQGENKRSLDFARSLARYLWAISMERDRHAPLLICLEHETPPAELEEFERHIEVKPLHLAGTENLVAGTLGRTDLEQEVVARIHEVTGGFPGGVRVLLADLIGNGLLHRTAGIWRFREVGRLADLTVTGAATRWALAWGRLSGQRRAVLALLSRLPRGLTATSLERALPGHERLLPELASRGWVRAMPKGWTLAAEEIRAAVMDLAGPNEGRSAEERLLADPESGLTREERGSLLLRVGPPERALEEGLWAGEQAAARGEHWLARDRATGCLRMAEAKRDTDAAQRAAIIMGRALHQMGNDEEAETLLQRESLWSPEARTSSSAQRLHLLGRITQARGRVSEARTFLNSAIDSAEAGRDPTTLMRAHADLAELDWRYGDEATRAASMERVRSVLMGHLAYKELNEERAALSYQFGSALILSGEREQAREFLIKALELGPGDFWRMRIANALGTACFYLGDFDKSLDWLEEAWRCAERGGIDAFKARILSNRAGLLYGLGRFREAVEQHGASAQWARRTGNAFEFHASRAGESINLALLGRYEEAIDFAREAGRASDGLGSAREYAKSLEMESLALYHIGDYVESRRLALTALDRFSDDDSSEVVPRLRWLLAKVDIESGDLDSAERNLAMAERELQRTKDWEDLPGVQIEAQFVRFRKGDLRFSLPEVRRLTTEADRSRALIVFLHGAIVIGEVVIARGVNDGEFGDLLLDALARAEGSGTAEVSWRLSYALGEIASRRADTRDASARFAHAVRRMTEVADRLKPEHRRFYLKTAHARRLLERASAASRIG